MTSLKKVSNAAYSILCRHYRNLISWRACLMARIDFKQLFSRSNMALGLLFVYLTLLACSNRVCGEENDVAKQLQEKGVTVTEAKGVGTTVMIKDCSKLV